MSWFYSGTPILDISTVPNLLAWYKADAQSYSDNDTMSTITDSSGNGLHLNGVGGGTPKFRTNILNGKPVFRYDGGSYSARTTAILSSSTSHLVVIVGIPRTNKFNNLFWPAANLFALENSNDLNLSGQQQAIAMTPGVAVTDSPFLFSYRVDGGSNTAYNNGLAGFSVSNGGGNSGAGSTLLGAGGTFSQSDVAEVVVVSPAPTLLVQQQIEASLRYKYGLSGSGAAPNSPDTISGLVAWFDANALSLNDNDAVNTWTDMSGNGYDATAGSAPTFKTNIQNSKPVVRFSTDRLLYSFPIAADRTGFTISMAIKTPGSLDAGGSSCMMSTGQSATTGVRWGWAAAGAATQSLGWAGTSAGVDLGSSGVSANTAYVLTWRKTLAGWTVYVNGSLVTTTADTSMPSGTWNGIIGAESSPGNQYPTGNDIAEICLYDRAISLPDKRALEDYLGAKWGVTVTH